MLTLATKRRLSGLPKYTHHLLLVDCGVETNMTYTGMCSFVVSPLFTTHQAWSVSFTVSLYISLSLAHSFFLLQHVSEVFRPSVVQVTATTHLRLVIFASAAILESSVSRSIYLHTQHTEYQWLASPQKLGLSSLAFGSQLKDTIFQPLRCLVAVLYIHTYKRKIALFMQKQSEQTRIANRNEMRKKRASPVVDFGDCLVR